jgi:hypothetical protein
VVAIKAGETAIENAEFSDFSSDRPNSRTLASDFPAILNSAKEG